MTFDEDFDFDAPAVPSIYDHTDIRGDFRAIDFNTQVVGDSLFRRRTVVFGVITNIDWLDSNQRLVVREANTYSYQIPNAVQTLPVDRSKTFTWFNRDGSPNPLTKTVRKFYDPLPLALEAATRRRKLLISELEAEIFQRFAFHFATDGVTPPQMIGIQTGIRARDLRRYLVSAVTEYQDSSETAHLIAAFADNTDEPLLDLPTTDFPTLREQAIARIL